MWINVYNLQFNNTLKFKLVTHIMKITDKIFLQHFIDELFVNYCFNCVLKYFATDRNY